MKRKTLDLKTYDWINEVDRNEILYPGADPDNQ